ncbi:MAG: indolepyruvate ferredoxin oxidoreductase subunit alpha [Planctomycetia bacterium]|nr:indolepyruvate ferredoxin oxidoreductase subunit alpha [Planctomycetia bacterium]
MKKVLLSGNEAIARGAYEAGVTVGCGYPGTPSTEILENLVKYKDADDGTPGVYCEWTPNEKVAMETAVAAALTGARTIVTMKHVGLNVAADPLMTFTYTGTRGGIVICVGDDPGMHSSQNEQDTRNYARFAKIPVLEPSDSQEMKDFLKEGLEISERFSTPVILRGTTRVCHSRSLVTTESRQMGSVPVEFERNPSRWVPIPAWARGMRVKVEDRLHALQKYAAHETKMNRIEWRDHAPFGIITSGVVYQYVRDVFPEASVLKLGMAYPFPDDLLREFASRCAKILVLEELDDIIEEHLRAMNLPGCEIIGRDVVPGIGELLPSVLMKIRGQMMATSTSVPTPLPVAGDLPGRPPVLCPGCPHRALFYALKKHDVIVTGDIGCYSLGVLKPLERMDTILCMGGGFSMTHGIERAGEKRKVVGVVGDSTFFHSGITGLLNIVYNKGTGLLCVLDNRTTAMTGHQDHPGTGKTLMGEETREASIAELARACGVRRVVTVDPLNMAELDRVIAEELAVDEPSVVITRSPCLLRERKKNVIPRRIDPAKCKKCGKCVGVGCPAIELVATPGEKSAPVINPLLCAACNECLQVCPFNAIAPAG